MAERIQCRICGGALELQADGRAQCLRCGLFYSAEALVALWPTGSASSAGSASGASSTSSISSTSGASSTGSISSTSGASSTGSISSASSAGSAGGEPQDEVPAAASAAASAADDPEDELTALQREQQRLLTEMRLADGPYGPAQRRQLNSQLRKVEKRLAQLEGRKLPFWF